MKYQILADSACDLYDGYLDGDGIRFKTVPLSIGIGDCEIVDDSPKSAELILAALRDFKGKTRSACPAPQAFLEEYGKADYTFAITITGRLSGCCNAATVARDSYSQPDHVFVIDSRATCGTEILIIEKLRDLIKEGVEFDEICRQISEYRDRRHLLFALQKFDNLVSNGRMSKVAAVIAKAVVIRPICRADDGEIKIAKKLVGSKSAFNKMVDMIEEECPGFHGGNVVISQCHALEEAEEMRRRVMERYGCTEEQVRILPTRGIASYYAMEGGVIMCF